MEFRLFGTVQALVDGQPVELGRRRERCLLGLLLLDLGKAVPADRLIVLLWDDDPPANPRAALQTYVSRLRARLAASGADRHGVRLRTSGGGYLAEADPQSVDLHRFRLLLERARDTDDHAERSRILTDALLLWRGAPLADVASPRLRERVCGGLDELRLSALELRVEADLALGRHHRLVPELTELAAVHPSRERLLTAFMLALHRDGRQGDALAVYRRGVRRLADEFGLDPSPELRRLHTAILRDDGSLAPTVGTGGLRPAPAELPAGVPDFTGRAAHLDDMDRLLARDDSSARTVLVVGTGGVGKTALAVHWGHRHADRFPDGQLYADLRGFAPGPPARSDEVLARFLRALGVRPDDVPVEVEEQSALYRTLLAHQRVLVVLDDVHDAEHVRPLLPGSPTCLTLVTSRDRLGGLVAREGAGRVTLDVLRPDEARALLSSVIGADRMAGEPDATAKLARLCGYLPLALRVAGANLAAHPGHTVASYASQLDAGNRLEELRIDGDERAAVTATFDLSYQRLGEPHRRLLRLLGLVPGPDFTPEAAAVATGTTVAEARQGLDRLAATHLCDHHEPGRYAFHDLLRLYAADRARRDDTETDRVEAVGRLLDWYLHRVDAAARLLHPYLLRLPVDGDGPARVSFADRAVATAWLDAERPNLVAAVQYAAEHGFARIAGMLSASLRAYFYVRCLTVDWINVARVALSAARAAGETRLEVLATMSLGQAAVLGSGLDSPHREPRRLDEAAEHFAEALSLCERIGWQAGQAMTLHNLCILHFEAGRLEEAAEYQRRSLAVRRRIGYNQVAAVDGLCVIYHAMGRLAEADTHSTEALALIAPEESFQWASTFETRAALCNDAGRHEEALTLVRRALGLARQIGDRRKEATHLGTLGAVQLRMGEPREAARHYERSLELIREVGYRYTEVAALIGLAAALRELGDLELAHLRAEQAVELAHACGYRVLEGQALTVLAETHLDTGDRAEATRCCEQALELHRATGHRLGVGRGLVVLGRAVSPRRGEEAMRHWRQALDIFTEAGARSDAGGARALLGCPPVAPVSR